MYNMKYDEVFKAIDIYAEMKDFSYTGFFSALAIFIDGYCADHGLDAINESAMLAKMVKDVNDELGSV